MPCRTVLAAAVLLCGLSGCGRDRTLAACEATERYAAATSAPPVQIPDDLSPPDETDSLRLPPADAGAAAAPRGCLESPPGFYADGAPGGTRLGNAPVRATPPPVAGAAPAASPALGEPDRQDGNAPLRPTAPPPVAPAPAAQPPADDPDPQNGNAPLRPTPPPPAAPAAQPPVDDPDRQIAN